LRGRLSLNDILRYAIDLTSAVDYAHQRGVLHRDLKPANIMITPTGLKLLDFGLAKASAPLDAQATSATRLATTLTEQGTILGTLNYMSPEQLEGGSTDGRADIFAIGAIIYEMVTGQRAFSGATPASVIAAILREDPPAPSVLLATIPAALERAVLKCLAKDREQRWQTVRDLASELGWIRDSRSGETRPRRDSPGSGVRTWLAAGMLIAATSAATILVKDRWFGSRVPELPGRVQFAIQPPPGVSFFDSNSFMAVSPDGRTIVFAGSDTGGDRRLWVRALDSLDARPLPGTEGGNMPFWAPDSRRVGFVANGRLKTIDIDGRNLYTVCEVKMLGASWGRDDVILIGSALPEGIRRVAATGGRPTAVTAIDASRKELAHNWPVFLPDGRHFLYRVKSAEEESTAVFVGSLDSSERRLVLKADADPEFAPPGYLLTGTDGRLVAQPFDLSTLRLNGSPVVLEQPVRYNDSTGRTTASVSQQTLVYRQPEKTELRWFGRNGVALGLAGTAARYLDPELSPDGSRLAVAKIDSDLGTFAISVIDLADGRIEPLTTGRPWDRSPVWSPDGRTLLFSSKQAGNPYYVYQKTIGAPGAAEPVKVNAKGIVLDRTPDGTILTEKLGSSVLEAVTAAGVLTLTQGRAEEKQGRFSHDGRWLAYVSEKSGSPEVYIRPASGGGPEKRISTSGGFQPRWRQDDRELYYLAAGGDLMAVDVTIAGPAVRPGTPAILFHAPLVPSVQYVSGRNQYDVSSDGQRFIMNVPTGSAPITVVLNWQRALRR
jgi:Tol biopolymer transport system component